MLKETDQFNDYFRGMAQANLEGVLETEKNVIRHVPYISLAMIVISLLFIDRVGDACEDLSLWCALYTSWILAFISVVMIAVLLYQSAIYKDTINQAYIEYSLDKDVNTLLVGWEQASGGWAAYGLALGSIASLLVGLACLLAFIGVNIYPW